jgi:hypothetical protein
VIKSRTDWLVDRERAHKMFENELLDLKRFADPPEKREAIETMLEVSKEARHRVTRSIESGMVRR